MVGISYNKGDVFCGHFEGAINGGKMEHIVQEAEKAFPEAFQNSIAPREKRVLIDGCPRRI